MALVLGHPEAATVQFLFSPEWDGLYIDLAAHLSVCLSLYSSSPVHLASDFGAQVSS